MSERKSESKKLALLYLRELFLEKTDSTHYIRMPEILEYLAERNVYVDRRTVYTDISLLNQSGFEITGVQEKGGYKYHHAERLFDTAELKFLTDAIYASKFLTEGISKELITKVKSLGSKYENTAINRNILSNRRVKSMNDKVFDNLDQLHEAISFNSQITFQYMHWNIQRELEPNKCGMQYKASPCAISLSDDNYYMIAYDEEWDCLRHYRVDKMNDIQLTQEPRKGETIFKSFDMVGYSRKTFNMFNGREETVTIEAANHLAGVFIDRFGESVSLRKNEKNPDTFLARVAVHVSPKFYAWVFGFGKDAAIVSPEPVRQEFINMAEELLANYKD